jgi:hypothetical protein
MIADLQDESAADRPDGAPSSAASHVGGTASAEGRVADETRERIRRLPPEVGAVLITVGVAGVVLPGPVGMPLLLAGGLALAPSVFGRFERWVEKRFPTLHWHGMKNVNRFIDDFERRYPPPTAEDQLPRS